MVPGTAYFLTSKKEFNKACIVQVDGTTAKGTSTASWSTAQPTGNCARYLYSSYIDMLSSLRRTVTISQKPGADPPPIFVAPLDAAVHLLFTNIISCEISGHFLSDFQYSHFFSSVLMLMRLLPSEDGYFIESL